ncbi:MAG: EFR1 family ferrodoxin [Oscillospiraceae bacterium]|nr:EFR1 family ferrodoxin [Oscillospiraceae bacterium]
MSRTYNIVYFSPTNTTKEIAKKVANNLSGSAKEFDITNRNDSLSFDKNDFVIIAIPVYSGRVPALAAKFFSSMRGEKTPAALIATFGNRHYDDSLLELKTIVQTNGFMVIAAAAFVTEHSVVQKFGTGRPNAEDCKEINKFSDLLTSKLKSWDATSHIDLRVKGNPNYRKYQTIPIKPHTTSSCVKCGLCAKMCPAGAIPSDELQKMDNYKCITCMRCVRICPQKAREFYKIEKFIAEKSLVKLCREYKYPEIFI